MVPILSIVVPPFTDGVDCEVRRVVGHSDENGTAIGLHVVDAIGHCKTLSHGTKIMVMHRDGFLIPGGTGVLEAANEFLLLGIHADDRRAMIREAFAQCVDVFELRVSVWTRTRRNLLAVNAQRIPESLEDTSDRIR